MGLLILRRLIATIPVLLLVTAGIFGFREYPVFNAPPEADSIRYLTGLHAIEGRSVYFADAYAWRGAPPGRPRGSTSAPRAGARSGSG